jgi:hypothetical protein
MASCPAAVWARQKIKRSLHSVAMELGSWSPPDMGTDLLSSISYSLSIPARLLGQLRMPLSRFPSSSDPSRSRQETRITMSKSVGVTRSVSHLSTLLCTYYKHGPFVAACLLSDFASSPPAATSTPDSYLACLSNTRRSGRMRIRCLEPVIVQECSRRHADHMAPLF